MEAIVKPTLLVIDNEKVKVLFDKIVKDDFPGVFICQTVIQKQTQSITQLVMEEGEFWEMIHKVEVWRNDG